MTTLSEDREDVMNFVRLRNALRHLAETIGDYLDGSAESIDLMSCRCWAGFTATALDDFKESIREQPGRASEFGQKAVWGTRDLLDRWRDGNADAAFGAWIPSVQDHRAAIRFSRDFDRVETTESMYSSPVEEEVAEPQPGATLATTASQNGVSITQAYGWFAYGPATERGNAGSMTIYLRHEVDGPWMTLRGTTESEEAYLAGLIDAQGEPKPYAWLASLRPGKLKASDSAPSHQSRPREGLTGYPAKDGKPAKRGKLPATHAGLIHKSFEPNGSYRLLNPAAL